MANDVIAVVDVSAATGNSDFNINQGWVRFYNHSINGLQIQLSDGEKFYLPPQARRIIQIDKPNSSFSWLQILVFTVNSSTPVSTKMVVEAFSPSDPLTVEDLASLGGVGNIGNSGVGTTAQYVKDDVDPSGTEFIEASVSSVKKVSIFNDGTSRLPWGVAQTTGIGVTAYRIISLDGQGEIDLQQLVTGTFRVQDDAPSTLMELFRGAGGLRLSGIGNKLKAHSQFTGTTTGTYNHNLGTTPTAVQACQSVVGSQTMGTDTWGVSTVHVTSGSGNAFVGEAKLYA